MTILLDASEGYFNPSEFRTMIDDFFGNGDGTVSATEVAEYEDMVEEASQEIESVDLFPIIVRIDGEGPVALVSYNLEIIDAEGPVYSDAPITNKLWLLFNYDVTTATTHKIALFDDEELVQDFAKTIVFNTPHEWFIITNSVIPTEVRKYIRPGNTGFTLSEAYFNGEPIEPIEFIIMSSGSELIDSDGDGIPDYWEYMHGLNPEDPNDALLDPDEDDFTNKEEYKAGTFPYNPDSDDDGHIDGDDYYPLDETKWQAPAKGRGAGGIPIYILAAIGGVCLIFLIITVVHLTRRTRGKPLPPPSPPPQAVGRVPQEIIVETIDTSTIKYQYSRQKCPFCGTILSPLGVREGEYYCPRCGYK
jgi:predicted RNA-binding Zn-ribbon protein involved in translation (DUF1610 family)